MLEQQIQNDLKAAMLAKDKVALASIRGIKAAIQYSILLLPFDHRSCL